MSAERETTLTKLFDATTLEDVLGYKPGSAPRHLITVNTTSTIADCIKIMLDKKISSIPVLDTDADSKCAGIVDMRDISRALIKKLEEIEAWTNWPDVQLAEFLKETPVTSVVDFAHGDPLLISSGAASVHSLMKFLASGLSHRTLVSLSDKKGYDVLSQVDVVSWLANQVVNDENLRNSLMSHPLVPEVHNRSSESHHVVQAVWTDSVYSILKLMEKEQVNAVALVDEDGRLQANFSATDLVHLDTALVSDIKLSGKDYLKKFSKFSLTPLAILQQEKDASLAETLMLFSGIGIHRIWLVDSPVDSKFAPSGVITITDVLQIVAKLI